MKKSNLIIAMTLMSTLSFADIKPANTTNQMTIDKDIKNLSKTISNDSASNRMDKKYSLNATILGLNFSTSALSAEASYFLNPTTTLGLQYSSLMNTSRDDTNSDQEAKLWEDDGVGSAITINAKKFLSNSFYAKAGLYYRTQKSVERTLTRNGVLEEAEYGEYEDIGLSVSIGNQWQFKNFTLGADWIGISNSLSILDQEGTKKYTTADLKSLSALNFYVGASF
jgi:hypothetical protein